MSTATRVDPRTGLVEKISFFGQPPRMFGAGHMPTDARAGVIICSSTHAELVKSYRQEVELARQLANEGVAVWRFQYRGTGNSEGDGSELTLDSMTEDAREAMAVFRQNVGDIPMGFVGVRLGAYPTIAVATEHGSGPIALWAPVSDTDDFLQDAFQSHYIAAVKGEGKPAKREELLEQLETEGSIELTGYTLTREFHSSLTGQRLAERPPRGHTVIVIPFDPIAPAALAEPWAAEGIDVTQLEGSSREAWWLGDREGEDRRNRRTALIQQTTAWLSDHLGL